MRKQEAIAEAKKNLESYGKTQFIGRRGDDYRVYSSTDSMPRGWMVAEMISTGNVQNY